jgi:hypothetical protein
MKAKSKIKITSDSEVRSESEFEKQLQELVIARLSAIPKNLQMAVGANQYNIEDLIKSVQQNDNVGKQLVAMQVQYLKDLSSGEVYKEFDDQQ